MRRAEEMLDRAAEERAMPDWRNRTFELAEALFQTIRMQLSVPWHKAIAVGRGANLDTIDVPLNNRMWLKTQFEELRQKTDEAERLKGLDAIVNWTDPGPGGFYDDLGDALQQPHLAPGATTGFGYQPTMRSSWWTHAEGPIDAPLKMRYDDLDPAAQYKIRVVYAGDSPAIKIRLVANGVEVHPLMTKPNPVRPVEFDLPKQSGTLELTWTREAGLGGNGRGNQVSEVWLIRK
jgi:hypothetical protein